MLTEHSGNVRVGGSFSSGGSDFFFEFFFHGGEYIGDYDEFGYPIFQNIPNAETSFIMQKASWVNENEVILTKVS